MATKPIILLLGVTGQIGKLLADHLIKDQSIALRVTSRHQDQLANLKQRYGDAVYFDLDDPKTFANALKGVQRAFLLTGYTAAMITQSKTFVDAAKKAKIEHLVHLGVYTREWDCTDPHFVWHQMVEVYIQHSQLKWTFLHPNCFMQNLTGFYSFLKGNKLYWWADDKPCGWVALEDVAEAGAKILIEGPAKHHGKNYWFSTESLTATQMAKILTERTHVEVTAEIQTPAQFLKSFGDNPKEIDLYFYGAAEFFRQIENGEMSYIGEVRDDMPLLTGRKGIPFKKWIDMHKEEILQKISQPVHH
jgi:NAD(P)H dehydrogenase (quinone)